MGKSNKTLQRILLSVKWHKTCKTAAKNLSSSSKDECWGLSTGSALSRHLESAIQSHLAFARANVSLLSFLHSYCVPSPSRLTCILCSTLGNKSYLTQETAYPHSFITPHHQSLSRYSANRLQGRVSSWSWKAKHFTEIWCLVNHFSLCLRPSHLIPTGAGSVAPW